MGDVLVWQTSIISYIEDSYSPVWGMTTRCRRERPLGPRLASSSGPSLGTRLDLDNNYAEHSYIVYITHNIIVTYSPPLQNIFIMLLAIEFIYITIIIILMIEFIVITDRKNFQCIQCNLLNPIASVDFCFFIITIVDMYTLLTQTTANNTQYLELILNLSKTTKI